MKKFIDRYAAVRVRLGNAALLLTLLAMPAALHAQVTLFGTPSNFDVLNDTGKNAYGFEVELDGIQAGDLAGVWPSSRFPYTIVTIPGGIVIHYASPYVNNQYTITTVIPAAFAPTGGHSCVLGAIPGCEHYGYYFNYSAPQPTNVINRWLVDDPQNPGTLIPAPGQIVQIPLPVVSVIPPVQAGQPPAVAFEIPAPVPPPPPIPKPELQFGEAKWVKVLKSEAQKGVVVDDLLEDNPVVPNDGNPAQVETEWKLLQFNPHSASSGVLHSQANLGQGSKAVVRKYEFYKYSGNLDPATQQALCGGDGTCSVPQPGELGHYIGTQMAAANVGVSSLTIAKAGTGSGTVTGTSINCGTSCTAPLALGTAVTLTAKPASNSTFTGWTGDCVGTLTTCAFTINGENNVAANFALSAAGGGGGAGGGGAAGGGGGGAAGGGGGATSTFKINISRNGKGSVTTNPTGSSFASGSVVTLTAVPDPGQPWTGWGGACSGTATTCTLTMNADKSITANFK